MTGTTVTYRVGGTAAVTSASTWLVLDLALDAPAVTACWNILGSGGGAQEVLDALLALGNGAAPSFALASIRPEGVRVVARGSGVVTVSAAGLHQAVQPPPGAYWADETLTGFDRIMVSLAGGAPAGATVPTTGGVIPADLLVIEAAQASAPVAHPPAAGLDENLFATVRPGQVESPDLTVEWRTELPVESPVEEPVVPAAPPVLPPASAPTPSGLIDAFPWELDQPSGPPAPVAPQHFVPTPYAEPVAPAVPQQMAPPELPPVVLPPLAESQLAPVDRTMRAPLSVPTPPQSPLQSPPDELDRTTLRSAAPEPPPVPAAAPELRGPDVVLGTVCLAGHPNPPHAELCRICRQVVPEQAPTQMRRPALGQLRLPTGNTFPVDRPILLGRAPSIPDGHPHRPHLIQIPGADNDISRNHAELTIEGWNVYVTDLGSTNGTTVALPGEAPVRLRPRDPFLLEDRALVVLAEVAGYVFEVAP